MHIVALVHRDQASSFGVSFPDLPGCIGAGDTEQEALENAAKGLAAHLALMADDRRDDGDDIPTPRSLDALRGDPEYKEDFATAHSVALLPFTPPGRTVRVNFTIEERLLNAIDQAAVAAGTTRSGYLADLARAELARTAKAM